MVGPHPRQPSGSTPTKPAGVRMGTMATCGLSAPPPSATSCGGVGARRWVDEALGESFSGVLVSDFYAAYHHLRWPQATVLGPPVAGHPRPGGALPQGHLAGPVGRGSPSALCRGQVFHPSSGTTTAHRSTGLGASAAGHLPSPSWLTRRLSRASCAGASSATSRNSSSSWPNRTCQRTTTPPSASLRHLVISRKVSGGTRSEQGTESKMTLASIFGAWRAQGLNPLAACRQLLTSPQV